MSEISVGFDLIVKQQKSMNRPVVSSEFISLREYQACPNDLLKNNPYHGPVPAQSGIGLKPLHSDPASTPNPFKQRPKSHAPA